MGPTFGIRVGWVHSLVKNVAQDQDGVSYALISLSNTIRAVSKEAMVGAGSNCKRLLQDLEQSSLCARTVIY